MVPTTESFPRKREPPLTELAASNRGPRLRGDDPVVAERSGLKQHAPLSLTHSPTTPIRHFPQRYLRRFRRAYTHHIRPPLGRTSTANDAGVGQADAGGSSLPWDRRRPPDPSGVCSASFVQKTCRPRGVDASYK